MTGVEITDRSSPSDAAELRDRLHEYNFDATGYRDGRSLSCFLRDVDGQLIAGLDGFTWGGYAKIEYLWVVSSQRGEGLGRRLLSAAEDEARARGCVVARVDSHAFQAPDFYRKYGYEEVGFVDDAPIGYGEYFFAKRLDR